MPTSEVLGSTKGVFIWLHEYASRFASFAVPPQHSGSVQVWPKHAQPAA